MDILRHNGLSSGLRHRPQIEKVRSRLQVWADRQLKRNPLARRNEMRGGNKEADLAGPGISTYDEVDRILPNDYTALLSPLKRMDAVFAVKRYIEDSLCRELNLHMVQVPLIVDTSSGVNDYLDRDGSRTPVDFECGLGLEKKIQAQIVQAATKWKRVALKQFGCETGEGICTDMKAVRKDYFLDHDHSCYVDQWDWEKVMTREQRNLEFLKDIVRRIWKILYGAGEYAKELFPELATPRYPGIPEELTFLHAEEILDMYPDLPRKQRETRILQKHPAIFIIGIGSTLHSPGIRRALRRQNRPGGLRRNNCTS